MENCNNDAISFFEENKDIFRLKPNGNIEFDNNEYKLNDIRNMIAKNQLPYGLKSFANQFRKFYLNEEQRNCILNEFFPRQTQWYTQQPTPQYTQQPTPQYTQQPTPQYTQQPTQEIIGTTIAATLTSTMIPEKNNINLKTIIFSTCSALAELVLFWEV